MDTQMTHAAQARSGRINFSGRGSEFFGIWIVNVLLSILTLGIYTSTAIPKLMAMPSVIWPRQCKF